LPPALRRILPDFVTTSTMSLLVFAAVLVVAVAVLAQVQNLLTSLLGAYTSEKLVLDCRAALFRHVQRLSFAYHDSKGIADTIYRIQNDVYAIQFLVLDGILPFISALIQLGVMVYIASRLDLKLVLMVLLVGPAIMLMTNLFKRRFRRQWDQVKEQETSALSVIQEVLAAARVVKAFGQEQREHQRYLGRATASLKTHLRVTWTEGLYGCGVAFVTRAAMACFFFIAARDVVRGVVSLGDLVLLMAYIGQVLMLVGLYILMGMGLNLEVGLAGLLDLGFVAFFAVGAFNIFLLRQFFMTISVETDDAAKIDGVKISLLDKEKEIVMRRQLVVGVRMYTGDDFNYAELIAGDEKGYSDALLGIFDAIAPAASAALTALAAGDRKSFDAILAPTVPLVPDRKSSCARGSFTLAAAPLPRASFPPLAPPSRSRTRSAGRPCARRTRRGCATRRRSVSAFRRDCRCAVTAAPACTPRG